MANETIRPAATGTRNGLPESGWYTYRGTGRDIMPWADSGDGSMDYDRGDKAETVPVHSDNRCKRCGQLYKSAAHKQACVSVKRSWPKCSTCGYSVKGVTHRILCGLARG
jgi:hypothetical protein